MVTGLYDLWVQANIYRSPSSPPLPPLAGVRLLLCQLSELHSLPCKTLRSCSIGKASWSLQTCHVFTALSEIIHKNCQVPNLLGYCLPMIFLELFRSLSISSLKVYFFLNLSDIERIFCSLAHQDLRDMFLYKSIYGFRNCHCGKSRLIG